MRYRDYILFSYEKCSVMVQQVVKQLIVHLKLVKALFQALLGEIDFNFPLVLGCIPQSWNITLIPKACPFWFHRKPGLIPSPAFLVLQAVAPHERSYLKSVLNSGSWFLSFPLAPQSIALRPSQTESLSWVLRFRTPWIFKILSSKYSESFSGACDWLGLVVLSWRITLSLN